MIEDLLSKRQQVSTSMATAEDPAVTEAREKIIASSDPGFDGEDPD